ncbi:MAG: extracellular solute-binding protein [Chloroflexi bacterium]|nr:extracellular solute-binding protein [Chloroflexota bacterium]
MKTVVSVAVLAIVLAGLVLAACAPGQDQSPAAAPGPQGPGATAGPAATGWEADWARALETGKREGTLTMYTTWSPDLHAALRKGFQGSTGIKVEFTSMGRGLELATKLQREQLAGLYLADVIGGASESVRSVTEPRPLVAPIDHMLILPDVKDPKLLIGGRRFLDVEDKFIIPLSGGYDPYFARNTELVREGELKSFADALDPKWKGRIVINDPTGSGGGLSALNILYHRWGPQKTRDFIRGLAKQEVAISRDLRVMTEGLAKGKFAVGIGLQMTLISTFKKMGAPIAVIRGAEGGIISPGPAAMTLPSGPLPHPNASRAFINWLLTKEGMTIYSKAAAMPSWRLDVSTEGFEDAVYVPGEPFTISDEEHKKTYDALRDMSREALGPLLK